MSLIRHELPETEARAVMAQMLATAGNSYFGAPTQYNEMSRETWDESVRAWPRAAIDWPENGGMLLLHGAVGTGKTHIALALLRLFWSFNWSLSAAALRFADCDSWLQALRADANRSQEAMEILTRDAKVLVVDDLRGIEDRWPFSIMRMVLRDRFDRGEPTIVTTNMTLDDLTRADPQLASRLVSGRSVSFEGEDERYKRRAR